MSTLPLGTLIAERFELEKIAGSGGMGTVFRANDRHMQRPVALKLLHLPGGEELHVERFAREARLVAELSHPGIISHVAHGQTSGGQLYLVMEWLEGESLEQRLQRGPLSFHESITLLQKVTEALGAAHRRGIVHRDLKPGNLFLREGALERVTILDFGLARHVMARSSLTKTGVTVGTPTYMAPEQARGERDIGPGADIFALGCVMVECLTGAPPFAAEHLVALLARILFDPAPQVCKLRADLPESFGVLIDRMLAKDPRGRPRDALALLAELAPLLVLAGEAPSPAQAPVSFVGADVEQQLFSVLVAIPTEAVDDDIATRETREVTHEGAFRGALVSAVAVFGARSEWLVDGSLVLALGQSESATDLASQAARCALVLQEHWPTARIAIFTAHGVLHQGFPTGDAVDRAAQRVRALSAPPASESPSRRGRRLGGIWVDELTRDLLDGRFALCQEPEGTRLVGEVLAMDETRPLLGRPTPCIGRDRELGFLETTLEYCIEESTSQAVLITARPGVGKSRLRHEFVRRLVARDASALVLFGRGDLLGASSPYGLLGRALRRLCGVRSGEALAAQQDKLREVLRQRITSPDAARVIGFLSEMCGVPSAEETGPKLRVARNDPKIMNEQISQAFIDWLRVECAAHPVLLVLEDLHWGDAPTVSLVDTALRELSDQPLMVLALARPEVKELFPKLFNARALKEIALGGLSKKASERLVRQVLGNDVSAETLARIVEQSSGNALYLEELMRAVADGKGEELPETVLAMLQVRLSRLSPGARRVLRCASVFGETFWSGGVRALLGHDARPEELKASLDSLTEAEVIERRRESRFPVEAEYRFRHALMRDAAYSMLTEKDVSRGHRLASQYLEDAGERDAMILAEHARQGGDPERAVPFYLQAAQKAYACSDWGAVRIRAMRGIVAGARGETRGILRYLEADTYYRRLELDASYTRLREAVDLLERGSHHWCKATTGLLMIAPLLGELAYFAELASVVQSTEPAADAREAYVETATQLSLMLTLTGQRALIHALLQRAQEVGEKLIEENSSVRAFMTWGLCTYSYALMSDPWKACSLAEECVQAFMEAEDMATLSSGPLVWLGLAEAALGERALAEQTFRRGLTLAMNRGDLMTCALHKVSLVCLWVGVDGKADPARADEARALTRDVLHFQEAGAVILGCAHGILARLLLTDGDLAGAEAQARLAVDMLASQPIVQTAYVPTLIYALLAGGQRAKARETADEAMTLLASMGSTGATEVGLRVAAAEALREGGDLNAAERALRGALHQVQIRADKIPDLAARERFLTEVADNARAASLARDWQLDPSIAQPP